METRAQCSVGAGYNQLMESRDGAGVGDCNQIALAPSGEDRGSALIAYGPPSHITSGVQMTESVDFPGRPRSRAELLQILCDKARRNDPPSLFGFADEIGEVIFGGTPTNKELLGLYDALVALKASFFGVARHALMDTLTPGEAPDKLPAETQDALDEMRLKGRKGFVDELAQSAWRSHRGFGHRLDNRFC